MRLAYAPRWLFRSKNCTWKKKRAIYTNWSIFFCPFERFKLPPAENFSLNISNASAYSLVDFYCPKVIENLIRLSTQVKKMKSQSPCHSPKSGFNIPIWVHDPCRYMGYLLFLLGGTVPKVIIFIIRVKYNIKSI